MHKDKLLKLIDRANRIEEDAVDSFSKHVQAAADWVDFNESEKKRIIELLKTLEKDSHGHKMALDNLKDTILKGNKNDY